MSRRERYIRADRDGVSVSVSIFVLLVPAFLVAERVRVGFTCMHSNVYVCVCVCVRSHCEKCVRACEKCVRACACVLPTAVRAGNGEKQKLVSSKDDTADMAVGMARSMKAMNLFNEAKGIYEKVSAGPEEGRQVKMEETHSLIAVKCLVSSSSFLVLRSSMSY